MVSALPPLPRPPPLIIEEIVYLIPCRTCSIQYVGTIFGSSKWNTKWFLLNPAYRLNEPWKDEAVVSGTTSLLKKCNQSFFGGKLDVDRDFPVELSRFKTWCRSTSVLSQYLSLRLLPTSLKLGICP